MTNGFERIMLENFPRPTTDEIKDIMVGKHQVNLSPSYIQDKQRQENDNIQIDAMITEPEFSYDTGMQVNIRYLLHTMNELLMIKMTILKYVDIIVVAKVMSERLVHVHTLQASSGL